MTERFDFMKLSSEMTKKLMELSFLDDKSAVGKEIHDLIKIRASQMNGCAFCVDMHVKQATLHGERPLRMHHVAIWRESTLFSTRERAALAWTEALTAIPQGGVPDALYNDVREQFSEKDISDLTFAIMIINAWNRANVAALVPPGSYDKEWGLDKANLN